MNARKPRLQLVKTREQTIEDALVALVNVMKDQSIPRSARNASWAAFKEIHASRSPETIARMEREMLNRMDPASQRIFLEAKARNDEKNHQ